MNQNIEVVDEVDKVWYSVHFTHKKCSGVYPISHKDNFYFSFLKFTHNNNSDSALSQVSPE